MFLLPSSVGVLLLALTAPAPANQAAVDSTEDVAGDTIQCDSTVSTIG